MAARHWSLALGAASVPISRMIKMLYDYWRSKSCLTVADISFRTGIPEQQLHQMIEEKKILPSYLIQSLGKEFVQKYTLQNLGEMMTLLRASEQPDNAATLLRAARDNPSDPVAQQTLLRPIEAEPTQKELIDVEQIGAKITEVKPTGYETVMVEERQIQLRH